MITIRKTIKEDANILIKIQKDAFKPLYEKYHDEGNPYLRNENDILSRLDREDSIYYTIMDNGQIVGGILYKRNCSTPFCKMLNDGEYYLCRVYIKPEVQSKQIARTAIKLCEENFTDATKYFVDFPEDLEMNRRCYESVGYVDTGKRLTVEEGLILASFCKMTWRKDNGGSQIFDNAEPSNLTYPQQERKVIEQIELDVVKNNEKAIEMYQGFGFEIVGTIPNALKYKDGTYADEYLMVKK